MKPERAFIIWRWVPSPQSNSMRSPFRISMNDGMPRLGVGMEPPVPRKMILSIADVYAFYEYDVYPVSKLFMYQVLLRKGRTNRRRPGWRSRARANVREGAQYYAYSSRSRRP